MIKVTLTNEILRYITEIEQNRYKVSSVTLSKTVMNKFRKNSKKKSSYASNKIEGNPLSEKQVDEVIESDERKHYLKPEQEVRNYFLALNYLEEKVSQILMNIMNPSRWDSPHCIIPEERILHIRRFGSTIFSEW